MYGPFIGRYMALQSTRTRDKIIFPSFTCRRALLPWDLMPRAISWSLKSFFAIEAAKSDFVFHFVRRCINSFKIFFFNHLYFVTWFVFIMLEIKLHKCLVLLFVFLFMISTFFLYLFSIPAWLYTSFCYSSCTFYIWFPANVFNYDMFDEFLNN